MDRKDQARYQARAAIFKALAHPTRLLVVDQLAEGERCVCELNAMVDVDVSTMSKHLSVLKSAGIVSSDKRGLKVFYKLQVPCVLSLFSCIEGVIQENAKQQMALLQ